MTADIDYTLEKIAEITSGTLIQQAAISRPQHLLLDSRKLTFPERTIFFSLHPDHCKSQALVYDLYKKGVTCFVIHESVAVENNLPVNYILVKNVLKALQDLAIYHRSSHDFTVAGNKLPVIGITGSNGKTIVKEWLNQLLENDFTIVRSPKSYNSQIGVPLSVLQINASHNLAIFEAGISKKGEMDVLEKMIRPALGVFTNIGTTHNEGFKNITEKIEEKLKLLKNAAALIFCADYPELSASVSLFKASRDVNREMQLFSWSRKAGASLRVTAIEKLTAQSVIRAVNGQKEVSITIPFIDDASIENAITCWCVLLLMNVPQETIAPRMLQLFPIEMRMELKEGINSCIVINDSYSADINSLAIALDFLEQQQQHARHTLILSDILQSGKKSDELYAEVAAIIQQKKIHKLVAIGKYISGQKDRFSFVKESYFYASVEEFKKNFNPAHFANETILIKGARIFRFEQIDQMLEKQVHQTILSINLDAIAHNLKEYRHLLAPSTRLMAMVKAFSYGSGSFEVAALLQFHKVDYLAVAYADEGIELRKAGITMPIMVMNPDENAFAALVEYDLEPEIFSFAMLLAFERYLLSSAINHFPVHIKMDTGMHRLGFESEDIKALAGYLHNNKRMRVQSVFSHLVASEDESEDEFTSTQLERFLQGCSTLHEAIGYGFLRHIANTSGISRRPDLHLDMVRLGIGLYGIDNNPLMHLKLRAATSLTTTIAQIKSVKKGETVGYGRTSKVEKDSKVATVRIGYADGYSRRLSNGKGKMLLRNVLVPVVGNVCMDMTMLDISAVDNAAEGDEVMAFGEQLPVQTLAEWSNSIPYEIMTGISQRVKRVYFQE